MEQLSKEETKQLEETSVPVMNVIARIGKDDPNIFNRWLAILGWTHMGEFADGSILSKPLHVRVAAMSELLGFRPNYHVNYWERNACWGLEHEGIKFVLYISNKGFSVQLARDGEDLPTTESGKTIIDMLFQKLVNGKYDPDFYKHFGEV